MIPLAAMNTFAYILFAPVILPPEPVVIKELAEILLAPEISPLTPLVTIPLAVMVTIVFPATLAIILLLALAKYTLLVPLLIYEPEPPPLADMVTLLTDVIRPLAATVMTGTIVELP